MAKRKVMNKKKVAKKPDIPGKFAKTIFVDHIDGAARKSMEDATVWSDEGDYVAEYALVRVSKIVTNKPVLNEVYSA